MRMIMSHALVNFFVPSFVLPCAAYAYVTSEDQALLHQHIIIIFLLSFKAGTDEQVFPSQVLFARICTDGKNFPLTRSYNWSKDVYATQLFSKENCP